MARTSLKSQLLGNEDAAAAGGASSAPTAQSVDWCDLFGDSFSPKLNVRLVANHDQVSVDWPDPSDFGAKVCSILAKDSRVGDVLVWTEVEWREAVLGVPPTDDWVRRLLLLCRAQTKAEDLGINCEGQQFLMLPDGLVVSSKLFWPPNQKPGKPRKITGRLPEIVFLVAMAELLADDSQLASDECKSADLMTKLSEWLQKRGACPSWFDVSPKESASIVFNLRRKLREKLGRRPGLPGGIGRFLKWRKHERR